MHVVTLTGRSTIYQDILGFDREVEDDFDSERYSGSGSFTPDSRRTLTESDSSVPTISDDAFTRIERMLEVNQYEQQIMGVVLLSMGINVRSWWFPFVLIH